MWSLNFSLSSIDFHRSRFGIAGGVKNPDIGTFAEYVVMERDQVILAPEYLDDVHLAAWPLGGLTAWRYAAFLNLFNESLFI